MKNWTFKQMLSLFQKEGSQFLQRSKHALEKEYLRVDFNGLISQKPHLKSLGSSLTHPYISTDFSEAQLELITPTFFKERGALKFLKDLHAFVIDHLEDEMLWSFSPPGILPNENLIPLACFGSSDKGFEKYLYRKGLAVRYGRKMQTLSGVHYNFSFSDLFWDFLYDRFGKGSKQTFISECYLKIVRNFLRVGWLNTYLFGASPVVDKSFFDHFRHPLKKLGLDTLYGEHATSIRMSHLGYYSKIQVQTPISYNSIEKYLRDLTYAVTTPSSAFKDIGNDQMGQRVQLNDHILQIEAEHYSRIRPKPVLISRERPLDALKRNGIAYLEVRSVDCDPYSKIGIENEQLEFLHLFLIYALFCPSPPLFPKEAQLISHNQNRVALFGRKPGLKLIKEGKQTSLLLWAEQILDQMLPIANLFSSPCYSRTLKRQKEKLKNPKLLLSQRILEDLEREKVSYIDFGCYLANKHLKSLKKVNNPEFFRKLTTLSEKSLIDQEREEVLDDYLLKGYEDMEISTQMIIRESNKRGIKTEIVDRSQNLILLRRGMKKQYLKQATLTSKDSLISYVLMENKHVTKEILQSRGLSVPKGVVCHSILEAKDLFAIFSFEKLVVKPKLTNYGIGISFIEPYDEETFFKAVKEAFLYGDEVILESYCMGKEYRFLVIGKRVVAVCHRMPANVLGDGKLSIKELVKLKNSDPSAYKQIYKINLGQIEKDYLTGQNLNLKSIPGKGERIFLRQNSNVSTGGDSIDCTEEMHSSYIEIAIQAAQAAQASFCGVDMIVQNLQEPSTKKNYHIIELNYNPVLCIHRYPVEGKKKFVERDVLDFMGFE